MGRYRDLVLTKQVKCNIKMLSSFQSSQKFLHVIRLSPINGRFIIIRSENVVGTMFKL